MASLEEAYSTEYGEVVDPELAYDLFWSGVITDKSEFRCPSELCDGKVTCINLDREKQDMHQSPHFRGYKHSDECDVMVVDNRGSEFSASVQAAKGASSTRGENAPDVFHLNRPENQLTKKSEEPALRNDKTAYKKGVSAGQVSSYSGSKYYSVRSLVSKFIRYKKVDGLTEKKVMISGEEVSYGNLFKGVYKQPLDKLPEDKLIYWGVAFIDYLEKQKCYHVKFAEKLSSDGKELRPSFFIHQGKIDEYPVRNLVVQRLEHVVKSKDHRAFVFVYSKPYATEKDGRDYINFEFNSLDYLEIRYLDLFDDLK